MNFKIVKIKDNVIYVDFGFFNIREDVKDLHNDDNVIYFDFINKLKFDYNNQQNKKTFGNQRDKKLFARKINKRKKDLGLNLFESFKENRELEITFLKKMYLMFVFLIVTFIILYFVFF